MLQLDGYRRAHPVIMVDGTHQGHSLTGLAALFTTLSWQEKDDFGKAEWLKVDVGPVPRVLHSEVPLLSRLVIPSDRWLLLLESLYKSGVRATWSIIELPVVINRLTFCCDTSRCKERAYQRIRGLAGCWRLETGDVVDTCAQRA